MHKLIGGHVDRMLSGAIAAVIDLDVFHQQRAGTGISAENSVRGAIVNHTIAQRNVVGVVINASETAARNVETFKDVKVRQSKLHRVRAATGHRTYPVNANPSNRNLVYRRARSSEYQIARIGRVAVNFRYVTRVEQRCDVLQFLECSGWTNLIRPRKCGAAANSDQEQCDYEVFHLISLRWLSVLLLCSL